MTTKKGKRTKNKIQVDTPKTVSLFALMNKNEGYLQRDIRRVLVGFFGCTQRQADDCFFAAITDQIIVQETRKDELKVYRIKA
jgi:hypothetical protein